MAAYFKVKKLKDGAYIDSANPIAQHCFEGWGSDQNAIDASFYGRGTGRRGVRGEQWCWTLSKEGVRHMIHLIKTHIDDCKYYAKNEVNAASELLTKLEKVAKEW